ncbi:MULTISPECIES: DUF167 family protein [unclassified Aureimonas]|uniref:DUF167 family protein n=1 Tax=unclassified Aureimonas TaxID=2615206 RepID=UPI0006FFCFF8|nr:MULTISPECIES: DUF167 family protein [unclassified Aureimonas]KQT61742.1 hypothetical protein ASG54_23785 [Aureimonas sp. Leaf460]KQT65699.1 hypothetical protein ASG62_21890 [Aureimonas sp. Leaf427]
MSRADFAETVAGTLRLHVRLTPRGGADRIDGVGEVGASGVVLLARVRAIPEKGRANAALIELIAEAGGWPKSALTLDAGSKSRVKVVEVSGDASGRAEGLARLRALIHQV